MNDFTWAVARDYRVVGASIRAVSDEEVGVYDPLTDAPWLHRHFGFLARDLYLPFAREYGLLGLGGRSERLVDWDAERTALRKCLELVDALRGRAWPGWQEQLIPRRVRAAFSPTRYSSRCRSWAEESLQETLGSKLAALAVPSVVVRDGVAQLVLTPTSLVGAIWILCAEAASGVRDEVPCLNCRTPIVVGRAEGGHRIDTKFCSDSCRVTAYQQRRRYAKALAADGVPPERIGHLTAFRGRVKNRVGGRKR